MCIFAYGQTGSGKTYTMHGSEMIQVDQQTLYESQNQWDGMVNKAKEWDYVMPSDGIVPRCIKYLFDKLTGISFKFRMSIIEIYKDTFIDVL